MKPFCGQIVDQEETQCNIMVIYEDQAAGERADSLLQTLSQRSGMGRDTTRNLWMFSLLQTPLLQEQAALEAAMADIIIASVSGKRDLTALVQDWLTRWLDHKLNRPYALGIVLDPQPHRLRITQALISTVKEIARAGSARFFLSAPETTASRSEDDFDTQVADGADKKDLLEQIFASSGREGDGVPSTGMNLRKPPAKINQQDSARHSRLLPENADRAAASRQESWLRALSGLVITLPEEWDTQSVEMMGAKSFSLGRTPGTRGDP